MKDNHRVISVIMPALNEEKNIFSAIKETLNAFDKLNIKGEVIVIDDGSKDKTGLIVKSIMDEDSRVRLIRHSNPEGIGASFWDGVEVSEGEAVVMIPGDNENYPEEILRYHNLLEHVDIVIPFIFNPEVRSLLRNMLSSIYRFIINNTFMINLNYTNGTVLYRKSILEGLKEKRKEKGFFFQTDILIRMVKKGYLFAEVPCRIKVRKEGESKALTFSSLWRIIKGYFRLIKDCYLKREYLKGGFSSDSITKLRKDGEFNS